MSTIQDTSTVSLAHLYKKKKTSEQPQDFELCPKYTNNTTLESIISYLSVHRFTDTNSNKVVLILVVLVLSALISKMPRIKRSKSGTKVLFANTCTGTCNIYNISSTPTSAVYPPRQDIHISNTYPVRNCRKVHLISIGCFLSEPGIGMWHLTARYMSTEYIPNNIKKDNWYKYTFCISVKYKQIKHVFGKFQVLKDC